MATQFLLLLNQIFPDRCEENEVHLAKEFSAADHDGSKGVSLEELKKYYATLTTLYDRLRQQREAEEAAAEAEKAAAAAKAAAEAAKAAKAMAEAAKKADEAAAAAAAEESLRRKEEARRAMEEAVAAAQAEQEEATRLRAEEEARIAASMVTCACGEKFLPHLLPQHQRSCEACKPKKEEGSVGNADNGANTFVPCEWCGRTFFPDRLAKHKRHCPQMPEGEGIRPTMTTRNSAVNGATVGMYDDNPGRRRRAFQMGAAVAAGALGQ